MPTATCSATVPRSHRYETEEDEGEQRDIDAVLPAQGWRGRRRGFIATARWSHVTRSAARRAAASEARGSGTHRRRRSSSSLYHAGEDQLAERRALRARAVGEAQLGSVPSPRAARHRRHGLGGRRRWPGASSSRAVLTAAPAAPRGRRSVVRLGGSTQAGSTARQSSTIARVAAARATRAPGCCRSQPTRAMVSRGLVSTRTARRWRSAATSTSIANTLAAARRRRASARPPSPATHQRRRARRRQAADVRRLIDHRVEGADAQLRGGDEHQVAEDRAALAGAAVRRRTTASSAMAAPRRPKMAPEAPAERPGRRKRAGREPPMAARP